MRDWLADRCLEWHAEHAPGFHDRQLATGGVLRGKCGYLNGCGYWRTKWWVPRWLWRLVE